jgi:ferritin-like metal-binding protein YciE
METARELFVHELNDMLDAERKLVDALGEMAEQSSRPELQKAFQSHQKQTEEQARRIEQVLEELEESPEGTECKGIKGLIEEQKTFNEEEDPSEDLRDIFNVGAASKVESYEIQAYTSLTRMAQELGLRKAKQLLDRNLREEQQTLKKMETFGKRLKPENPGMEEEESEMESRPKSGRRRRAA